MSHKLYGRVPQEGPSLWGGTMPTRQQDPRVGRFLAPKEYAEITHDPRV